MKKYCIIIEKIEKFPWMENFSAEKHFLILFSLQKKIQRKTSIEVLKSVKINKQLVQIPIFMQDICYPYTDTINQWSLVFV